MNDNTNLFTHMRTDPNAWKHALIGGITFGVTLITLMQFCGFVNLLLYGLTGSFTVGVSIELWQRLQGGTNTNRESIMDILTTTWWFLYLFRGTK